MDKRTDQTTILDLAAEIVSAYVSSNRVQRADLAGLISEVHQALTAAETGTAGEPAAPEQPKASPQEIRRSVKPDHLVSFEDGKRYKTLRRHLSIRGLTPQAYREKWGLPSDYPMVASRYSQQRSELARSLGLGQQRREGLAKGSASDALRIETFEEVAETAAGGVAGDDAALAQAAAAPEGASSEHEPKRAAAPRARKGKAEPAPT